MLSSTAGGAYLPYAAPRINLGYSFFEAIVAKPDRIFASEMTSAK